MKPTTRCALVALALSLPLSAQEAEATAAAPATVAAESRAADTEGPSAEAEAPATEAEAPKSTEEEALDDARRESEALSIRNKLDAERLQAETSDMRAEVARLRAERELLTERMQLEAAQRQLALRDELAQLEEERERITREGELAKALADKLTNDLKALQTEAQLEVTRLQGEISRIETAERRGQFADAEPVYLENPLREDGMLVISDRRIPLNGLITMDTADFITSRIHYWNNKDRELPIFIVIDASPGGSVMAGYRILKAMEASDAPIHVVVKSFAASMAAGITTLAHESYAYPNAVLLHHQISSRTSGQLNLTQQREFYEESQRWWVRLASPIAEKMGVTLEEFIEQMYANSTSGDWSEFGEDAQKLKWVNHIIAGIDETSFTRNPDNAPGGRPSGPPSPNSLDEEIDAEGKPYAWLPRLMPKDVYFLYNPDNYYRMR